MGNIARSLLRAFGPRHSSISTGGGPSPKKTPFRKPSPSKSSKSLGSPPPQPASSSLPASGSSHETPPHQTTHMSDYHIELLRSRYRYWMWVMSIVMVVCVVDVGMLDYLWVTWVKNS
ncbi:hypothetical protein HDU89_007271 [Geranomyces variabilis]|nr:hypothetical protein HDU89_007271 [Geranomyces variabilis]